jgi:lactoylglutathione lyase
LLRAKESANASSVAIRSGDGGDVKRRVNVSDLRRVSRLVLGLASCGWGCTARAPAPGAGNPAAVGTGGSAAPAPSGGGSAATGGGGAPAAAHVAMGLGGSSPMGAGGSAANADAGGLLAVDAATAPVDGGSPAPGDGAMPAAVVPHLVIAGIGVSDLAKSTAFYTDVMGMKPVRIVKRDDRDEQVMHYSVGKGSDLVLMHYKDARSYTNIPAKVVFYFPDVNAQIQKVTTAGYPLTMAPIPFAGAVVGMSQDPDGYTIEMVQQNDPEPFFLAVGIGVSNLDASLAFYTTVMGMKMTDEYALGTLDEKVMQFEGTKGSGVVLMRYNDLAQRNYKDNPVKQQYGMPDAAAFTKRIAQAGFTVLREPSPLPALDNHTVGVAKDPDGYLLEFVQE